MSVIHLSELIGKTGQVRENGLVFDVRIKGVKQVYGVRRYLVTPVKGYGQTWMNAERIRVMELS
jgi:hypothetical protein